MKNNSMVEIGIVLLSMIIFAIILVLKLTGSIGWSWWLIITAPLWLIPTVGFAVFIILLAVYYVDVFVAALLDRSDSN